MPSTSLRFLDEAVYDTISNVFPIPTMKQLPFVLLALMILPSQGATVISVVGLPVPDNSPIGLSITFPVTSTIVSITELSVILDISGGWAGDMYCYLTHDSGFSVLLNRPGRSLSVPDGSGATSLLVSFADNGLSDIHTGIADDGDVTGIFQPDARTVDPDNSVDTSPRTAFLSSFNGLDPNGLWSLYVADLATGDTMILNSFALNIMGNAIPEPSVSLLAAAGAGLVLRRRRRKE